MTQQEMPLALPPFRMAKVTAEVVTSATGSPNYYVYADGHCCDQGIARTAEDCVTIVRNKWSIEPQLVQRKPYVKKEVWADVAVAIHNEAIEAAARVPESRCSTFVDREYITKDIRALKIGGA